MNMQEELKKLGKAFHIARLENDESGYDVEFEIGITQPTISKLERGERMCRIDTLLLLSDHYGYEFRLVKKCES